jgi:hypothetical protein
MNQPLTEEQQLIHRQALRDVMQPFPRRRDRVGARHGRGRKELIFTEITGTDAGGEVVARAVQTYRIV